MIYSLGNQLGLRRDDIDELLTNKLEICSQCSRTIMTSNASSYKAGTHYGTISIKDFE